MLLPWEPRRSKHMPPSTQPHPGSRPGSGPADGGWKLTAGGSGGRQAAPPKLYAAEEVDASLCMVSNLGLTLSPEQTDQSV